jgi:hypothetical protein
MILFIFHMNADMDWYVFQEKGWQAPSQGCKVSLQDIFRRPCRALWLFVTHMKRNKGGHA